MRARELATTPLAALGLALVAYVTYAHVAAYRARRPPDVASFAVDVRSRVAMAQAVRVDSQGGAAYRWGDGRLIVSGPPPGPDGAAASLRLTRDEVRLADVRLRMRFRQQDAASGSVFVALVAADDATRELRFTLHGDGSATITGDASGSGARQELSCAALPRSDRAGSAPADAWHELALRVSPQLGAALGSLDGEPVASCAIGWATGAPVRAAFGALGDGSGPLAIELAELDGDTIPTSASPETFADRFEGKFVDPLRWAVLLPDPWLATTETRLLPGGGLWANATGAHATDLVSGLSLVTGRVELASFKLAARVRLRQLHAAAVFIGVGTMDNALVARRSLEAGLFDAGGAVPSPFVAGHWTGSGQHSFESLEHAAPSPRAPAPGESVREIEVSFDAGAGMGRVVLDGETLFERPVDLRALEDVTFRFGVNLHEPGARAEVVVEEVRLSTPL
jgi:hypothetical protein